MGHVPHLYIHGEWATDELGLSISQKDHLGRVLKVDSGSPVSYTNGAGVVGSGTYDSGAVIRGVEQIVDRSTELVVAAPPPASRDRARFLVEKLGELGVARLEWLLCEFGNRRVPAARKTQAWAVSALEQSRGAWLLEVGSDLVPFEGLSSPVFVADSSAKPADGSAVERPRTVVIGPEGGWRRDEIPETATRFSLGPTILRLETAAVVSAAIYR